MSQPALEQVEIYRFREEARSTEILAIFLGCHTSFAGDDEDPDARRVTERMQTLAEIKTGELGHHQVEKDGVRLMLHRQSHRLIRISGVKNLIRTFQPRAQQAAHCFIVIHNQYLRHRDSPRRKGPTSLSFGLFGMFRRRPSDLGPSGYLGTAAGSAVLRFPLPSVSQCVPATFSLPCSYRPRGYYTGRLAAQPGQYCSVLLARHVRMANYHRQVRPLSEM